MEEIAVASSPENNYLAIFKGQIVRKTHIVLARVQQAEPVLPPRLLKQALSLLGYSLELSDAWPGTRELLLALAPQIEQAGYRDEWLPYLEQGIQLSRQLGDLEAGAELHLQIGILCQLRGRYEEADTHLRASVRIFEDLDDPRNRARALNRRGQVAQRQRRFAEAITLVKMALELLREAEPERAYSYFVLGMVAFDKRAWPETVEFCQQSLRLWERQNNPRMIGRSLTILGAALLFMKQYSEAITACEKAISLLEAVHDPVHKAMAQMNLGNIYLALEQPEVALECYLPAERIFRQARDRLHLAHINHNIGLSQRQLQQWNKAKEAYSSSIEQWQQLGNIERFANSMDGLGLVYLGEGQSEKAKAVFEEALQQLAHIEGEPGYDYWLDTLSTHLRQASDADNQ